MRYSNYLWVIAAFFFNQMGCTQTLSEKIDGIIAQQLPHATVGILIKDAQSGQLVYSRNADKLLSPASGMKILTAAAALYQLKPDYRFITTLSRKNQDYYIQFTGSPSFTVGNLNSLLQYLQKNSEKVINGNVVIDSSQYQSPNYPSGTSYDDLGWYYAAPDTAAILNENKVVYELISAKELGKPAVVKPKTLPKALTLINEVVTVSKEEEKNHCSLNLEIKPQNTMRLYGCMIQEKNPKLIELAIPDPILLVKQVVKKAIDKSSLVLKGTILTGKSPSDAAFIASFQSKPLNKLIKHMLQQSDNLYANSITKKLGYTLTGKGSHKEGAFAIKKILSEHTHLDLSQMEIVDGEGTRYNLVTAEQMVILLSDLYQDKDMNRIFFEALPQAGVSGTLKDRMKKTMLEKKVYAKTGSMHDISSLSGYMINPNEKTFIFSIIINGVNQPLEKAKSLEEKILLALDEYSLEGSPT
ncbi:D-alanyl-D-alanine carboxypeptidase/D-alanyl-D-alanine-endopeptidase [Legionella sp. PATHC035]|uniref:D-alanyl-D-alanine carboxypeptidase/D-alanyl-D-alanine endopeptidase n=1 Tax=Legionella sp. PATHC035 TaxID=2992040 RepID=UPI002244B791|nr:D-alanyl-D-alanine carboxypeptidase/D-alanyl-D-alanine-endopeptidase [Legionella sp. PATHC035]MCW8407424.1 D-alanyl-D-alanine carboxypeptidase/D-alanyl-D-alanine-endopeptidase [Legionella sp. PATHC035]